MKRLIETLGKLNDAKSNNGTFREIMALQYAADDLARTVRNRILNEAFAELLNWGSR